MCVKLSKNKASLRQCKNLKCKDNWEVVDPHGKLGGLLLFWGDNLTICKIEKSEFFIEVEVEWRDFEGKWWIIFVYLSPHDLKRGMK